MEQLRNRVLEILEHEDKKTCDRIREEIFHHFCSPELMWQDTEQGRKAYRAVRKALRSGRANIEKYVAQADDIWGHADW